MREDRLGRRVRRALDRLERAFGRPRLGRRYRPLDELVLTVLSQNTHDRNRDRAFAALRRRFPDWNSVLAAAPGEIEETIRMGGLARIKARVIRDILRRIRSERGALSLDFLRRIPAAEARGYLERFKGVGQKTVCCVLLFSCGHPAFPVDTHVHRVTRRLGWVPERATPATSHVILARLIPSDRYFPAHVNLITLGRRICRPRNPACPSCPLRRSCRFAASAAGRRRPPRRRRSRA